MTLLLLERRWALVLRDLPGLQAPAAPTAAQAPANNDIGIGTTIPGSV